jgi:hypothetical protein
MTRKIIVAALGVILLFGAGMLVGANKFRQPKSIVHVVTVRWKADATEQQRQAALDGVKKMAAEIPGITNVWTKTLKVQGEGYHNAFVMEFANEKAFKGYDDHPSHREWEKIYVPIRDRSTTHDITN